MTLRPAGYRTRLIDREMEVMLRSFGAVSVEGLKWCGKTWTSRNHANTEFSLADPSNGYNNRRIAKIDTEYVLSGDSPHLIDEWQEVPQIWDAVRFETDKSGEKGRFILCGSSAPNRDGIMHSGAGRIGTLRMRTMSLFESGDSEGKVSLRSMFAGGFKNTAVTPRKLRHLIDLTVRGGWPGSLNLSTEEAGRVNKDYIRRLSEEDIARTDGIRRDPGKVARVMRSLARNESTTVSNSRIKSDIKEFEDDTIDAETVAEYRRLLERLFVTEDQPAFSPNVRSSVRVGKSPKRHFTDPSLATAALDLTSDMLINDLNTYGFMFEAMCERDLQIYAQANGGKLYHYRDSGGREIDAVVEMPGGLWGAFEIKLGTDSTDKAAENLIRIKDVFENGYGTKPPGVLCVVSGLETHAYKREDGVYVVPLCALKD